MESFIRDHVMKHIKNNNLLSICQHGFVLFINDMSKVVHNSTAMFADDAKLYSGIKTEADSELLQQDLQALQ